MNTHPDKFQDIRDAVRALRSEHPVEQLSGGVGGRLRPRPPVEEVAEHLYAVDRLFFHVTQHLRGVAGLRLGRVSEVPENDRP